MSAHTPAAPSSTGGPPPSPGGIPRAAPAPATNVPDWANKIAIGIIVLIAIVTSVMVIRSTFFSGEKRVEERRSQQESSVAATTARPPTPAQPAVELDAKPLMVPGASSNDFSVAVDRPDGHTVDLCNGTAEKVRVQHRFKYQSTWTDLEPGTRASFEQFRLQALGPDGFEGCYRFVPNS